MALRAIARCGARLRRRKTEPEPEPHLPETEPLGLTGLGESFIEVLRRDERFTDVMADPFGEQPPAEPADQAEEPPA